VVLVLDILFATTTMVTALAHGATEVVPVGDEPLRTLSRMRMLDGEPVFGVRYSVQQPGCVRVGDRAESLG